MPAVAASQPVGSAALDLNNSRLAAVALSRTRTRLSIATRTRTRLRIATRTAVDKLLQKRSPGRIRTKTIEAENTLDEYKSTAHSHITQNLEGLKVLSACPSLPQAGFASQALQPSSRPWT